jgi:hypothetical protein
VLSAALFRRDPDVLLSVEGPEQDVWRLEPASKDQAPLLRQAAGSGMKVKAELSAGSLDDDSTKTVNPR